MKTELERIWNQLVLFDFLIKKYRFAGYISNSIIENGKIQKILNNEIICYTFYHTMLSGNGYEY